MSIEKEIINNFIEIQSSKLKNYSDQLNTAAEEDRESRLKDFKADKELLLYFRFMKINPKKEWERIIKESKLLKDEAMEIINACKTQEQLVKWWMVTYKSNDVSFDVYKKADRLCDDMFKYINQSGYSTNNQVIAQMRFISYDTPKKPINLKIMRHELNIWLKYIRPDSDGWKMLNIMEPSLSINGSYYAYVKDDNMKLRHGRYDDIINDKIDNVLKFMTDRFKEED